VKLPAWETVGVTPTRAMPLVNVSRLSVGVKTGASMPSTSNRPRSEPLALASRTVSKGGRSATGVRPMSRWRRRKSCAASTNVLNVAAGIFSRSPDWTLLSIWLTLPLSQQCLRPCGTPSRM